MLHMYLQCCLTVVGKWESIIHGTLEVMMGDWQLLLLPDKYGVHTLAGKRRYYNPCAE